MANKGLMPKWKKWDDEVVKDTHGRISFYRDLYYGRHSQIFERAKKLIEDGEIVDNIYDGKLKGNVRTPYLMANVSKLICEIPALLVSNSVGKLSLDTDQTFQAEGIGEIDPEESELEGIKLSKILEEIERASKFKTQHYTNVLQHQMDGGIVGIPEKDDNGVRIVFKKRDVYFPHEDDLGCDLVFKRKLENEQEEMEEFLHVIRQRVEDGDLTVEHFLYRLTDSQLDEVEEEEAKALLELEQLTDTFEGRNRQLAVYWANDATFDYPLGQSALSGQGSKQDEINWTLTRNGITFERNGKPRLAVSKQVMNALMQKALDKYGDESLIDHRDLEIMTMDENGKALEVIQVDVTKIGDIAWVKDLMKMMFIETKTSEKAVDFYMEDSGTPAQSGVAKFYDLFISIVKAEKLRGEYVDFIQELVENCLWLMSLDEEYSTIEIVRPNVQIHDMIPQTEKERIETQVTAVEGQVRSKDKAVRNVNIHDSEEAIQDEIAKIEEGQGTPNSNSGNPALQFNNMQNLLDNRQNGELPNNQGQTNTNTAAEGQNAGAGQ
jgi:hypothetical protein